MKKIKKVKIKDPTLIDTMFDMLEIGLIRTIQLRIKRGKLKEIKLYGALFNN